MDLHSLVQQAADNSAGARQTRAAARLMSLLEEQPHRLPELFEHIPSDKWPRPRLVLGITGAPGSGKSSLTDAIIADYRHRYPHRKIGAIAVDPTSPYTGGAILGDRVRMMRHALDPMVFIRSLATRGHLGGLSLGVRGVLRVMGLTGCDLVIIETVGVGQSEIEIAGVADHVLVVLAPGQGDSIQMLKAGLLEIADVFAVNKADTPGADLLASTLRNTLSLSFDHGSPEAQELPEIFLVSATEQTGLTQLIDAIEETTDEDSARWKSRREAQVLEDVRDAVMEVARLRLVDTIQTHGLENDLRDIVLGRITVQEFAQTLFEKVNSSSEELARGNADR